jgi:hypothetical protein
MIDYAQIETEATELARQFWEELEEELIRQRASQSYAVPAGWHGGADLVARISALDEARTLSQGN